MQWNHRLNFALLGGAAAAALAGLLFSWSQGLPPAVIGLFAAALLLLLLYLFALGQDLRLLRSMGIVRWEKSMSSGTTTGDCVRTSQTHLRFMGIGASKWLADRQELRRMLQRHAGNGGRTEFLLLDPDSVFCRRFEGIKNQPEGSLARRIKENTAALLSFRSEHFPISVRFYNQMPRFRIAIVDHQKMIIGLYSFVSESGENTPQIVLDNMSKTWSYYTAFNAYFETLWEEATPTGETGGFPS